MERKGEVDAERLKQNGIPRRAFETKRNAKAAILAEANGRNSSHLCVTSYKDKCQHISLDGSQMFQQLCPLIPDAQGMSSG